MDFLNSIDTKTADTNAFGDNNWADFSKFNVFFSFCFYFA